MPFSFYSPPTLTAAQASPWASVPQQALGMYSDAVKAKYMPQQQAADIFNKQFAPLAQIASNPLAMAMMGDKGQGVMQMISQLMQQSSGTMGAAGGGGAGGTGGGGLLSRLFGGGNNTSQATGGAGAGGMGGGGSPTGGGSGGEGDLNNMPPPGTAQRTAWDQGAPSSGVGTQAGGQGGDQSNISSNYGTGGTSNQAVQKALAPYSEQQHTAPYAVNNGKQVLAPLDPAKAQANLGHMQDIDLALPLLDKVQKEADEIQDTPTLKRLMSGAGSYLAKQHVPLSVLQAAHLSPENYKKFQQYMSDRSQLSQYLWGGHGYADNEAGHLQANKLVDPGRFESAESMHSRYDQERETLKALYKTYARNIALPKATVGDEAQPRSTAIGGSGQATAQAGSQAANNDKYEGKEPPKNSIWMDDDQGNRYPVHQSRVAEAKAGFVDSRGIKHPPLHEVA